MVKLDGVKESHEQRNILFNLHSQKWASCSKSAAGLLSCSHQGDISIRSHCLFRRYGNKSAASCQQACCKLIAKTFYPQV